MADSGSPPFEPAARTARRLGVFGGSFDPPHRGHLHVAQLAKANRELDHVLFVPAAHPPHKPDRTLASDDDRLAMLALLIEEDPWASVWTGELGREGPSYTIDTLRELRAALPLAELFLVMGEDNLPGLCGWKDVGECLALATPLIAPRGGVGPGPGDYAGLGAESRSALERGWLEGPSMNVSSTELRASIACGDPTVGLVPLAVLEYARARGLYGSE